MGATEKTPWFWAGSTKEGEEVMPRIKEPTRTLADVLRHRLGWKRSRKGNPYKRLADGTTVTVFARQDGGYGQCVYSDEHGARYSPDRWETELDAVEGANDWIERAEIG